MKIYCESMGRAWLLSRDGIEVEVSNHPLPKYQFEDIIEVLSTYGTNRERNLVSQYKDTNDSGLRDQIISAYNDNWCKIRSWGNFNEELIFRINSVGFNWYRQIIDFLLTHPMFKNSAITVESDKSSGSRKVYWDKISYSDAIDSKYEEVLATQIGGII